MPDVIKVLVVPLQKKYSMNIGVYFYSLKIHINSLMLFIDWHWSIGSNIQQLELYFSDLLFPRLVVAISKQNEMVSVQI